VPDEKTVHAKDKKTPVSKKRRSGKKKICGGEGLAQLDESMGGAGLGGGVREV